ncbi:MAG: hypothetical protein ACN23H_00495 [Candidatus Phytoplasma vitis]
MLKKIFNLINENKTLNNFEKEKIKKNILFLLFFVKNKSYQNI